MNRGREVIALMVFEPGSKHGSAWRASSTNIAALLTAGSPLINSLLIIELHIGLHDPLREVVLAAEDNVIPAA